MFVTPAFFVSLLSLSAQAVAFSGPQLPTPAERADFFHELYLPFLGTGNDLMSKVVDNKGNGNEDLYGVRNFRVVLHGALYRGGANNAYHRTSPRENSNPLPEDGLRNLCSEGFGRAIYLYATNFHPFETRCTNRRGEENPFVYEQLSPLGNAVNTKKILTLVHDCLKGEGLCPIYTHCWNGWHASGFVSAVALRQFCGYSAEEALQYWIDGTDSPSNHNYPSIKEAIRSFVPDPALAIDEGLRAKVCPQSPYHP